MRWFKMALAAVIALAFSAPSMAQEEKKAEKRQRPTAEQTFKRMDADGDGKLTKEEFKKYVEGNERMAKRAKDNPDYIDSTFKRMDGDGDGKVTLDEYKKYSESNRRNKKGGGR